MSATYSAAVCPDSSRLNRLLFNGRLTAGPPGRATFPSRHRPFQYSYSAGAVHGDIPLSIYLPASLRSAYTRLRWCSRPGSLAPKRARRHICSASCTREGRAGKEAGETRQKKANRQPAAVVSLQPDRDVGQVHHGKRPGRGPPGEHHGDIAAQPRRRADHDGRSPPRAHAGLPSLRFQVSPTNPTGRRPSCPVPLARDPEEGGCDEA